MLYIKMIMIFSHNFCFHVLVQELVKQNICTLITLRCGHCTEPGHVLNARSMSMPSDSGVDPG